MIKKLNIVVLLIIGLLSENLHAQSDKILFKGECNINNITFLTSFLSDRSKIEISPQISLDNVDEFNNHAIIILCSDAYLKLSEIQIINLQQNILNGSLLIIDNFTYDYTFSIFLKVKNLITTNSGSSANLLAFFALINPMKKNRLNNIQVLSQSWHPDEQYGLD